MYRNDVHAPAQLSAVMQRVEMLISRVLLAGVVVSMATVLMGLVLMFVHHPQYLKSAAELRRQTDSNATFPHSPGDVARGIAAAQGQAIVAFGLVLLIATPILRVAIAMIAFAIDRDPFFAAVSAIVLALLAVSFLLGRGG